MAFLAPKLHASLGLLSMKVLSDSGKAASNWPHFFHPGKQSQTLILSFSKAVPSVNFFLIISKHIFCNDASEIRICAAKDGIIGLGGERLKRILRVELANGTETTMGVVSNSISRDDLKPGDHIYSWRHLYIYAHHGIYVGDGKVIHFTCGAGPETGIESVLKPVVIFSSSSFNSSVIPCTNCGDLSGEDGVISSCLDCFLCGGNLYRFEYGVSTAFFIGKARGGTCTHAASDPPQDVLFRAFLLLEHGFGIYNISKNNCEDFAIYCKTGLLVSTTVGRSGQFTSFAAAVKAVPSVLLRLTKSNAGLAAVSGVAYCVNRYVSDIGIRSDVTKVPVEKLVADAKSGVLEIGAGIWEQMSMYIVTELPISEGYEAVLVVIDQLTKYAHFILLKHSYTAESIAQVFAKEIIPLHGLPQAIISDGDPLFMIGFWKELSRMQRTKLQMSCSFHPETNAEMDDINRCLEYYLRCFAIEQPKLWSVWIHWAEFWYNTSFHMSMGTTPFEAAYRKKPPTVVQYIEGEIRVRAVARDLQDRDEVICKLKHHLSNVQVHMEQPADHLKRRNVVFEYGRNIWNVYRRTEETLEKKRRWGFSSWLT